MTMVAIEWPQNATESRFEIYYQTRRNDGSLGAENSRYVADIDEALAEHRENGDKVLMPPIKRCREAGKKGGKAVTR